MSVSLTFLGGAREVTGSCILVQSDGNRFLVDCGMFQGGSESDRKNARRMPVPPRSIDFVLTTHAHIDHTGLLPKLVRDGFPGPVHCTSATADLMNVMLPDSGHIQEREAEWENRKRRRKGKRQVVPLYTEADAQAVAERLRPVPYGKPVEPASGVSVTFLDAGHILGSAIIEVRVREAGRERRLVFSGDLGQPARPVVRDPETVGLADVLLVESTYGDRLHRPMDATVQELVEAVRETLDRRRGNLIVPAFALGRAQDLLILLFELCERGELEGLNVFVDSPLARQATAVTLGHLESLDPAVARFADAMRRRRLPYRLRFTRTPEESMAINAIRSGAIVIAASGMCEAGRIRHHLRHNLAREECGIIFTGFQAGGTLGRRIVDGARSVRLFGETVPVRARIHTLGGLSAHADQRALLAWLSAFRRPPGHTFVVHGEESAAVAFGAAIEARLGWRVRVPEAGETAEC
jgi:metallo-beta-lactamase family protein